MRLCNILRKRFITELTALALPQHFSFSCRVNGVPKVNCLQCLFVFLLKFSLWHNGEKEGEEAKHPTFYSTPPWDLKVQGWCCGNKVRRGVRGGEFGTHDQVKRERERIECRHAIGELGNCRNISSSSTVHNTLVTIITKHQTKSHIRH